MIDIEQCAGCEHIGTLVECGLDAQSINAIGRAANHGAEVRCVTGPEQMPGGWTHCGARERVQGGLAAAAVAIELQTVQESYVTV